MEWSFPARISLFKVNNRNTRAKNKNWYKLRIKTSERFQWCWSAIFTYNFEVGTCCYVDVVIKIYQTINQINKNKPQKRQYLNFNYFEDFLKYQFDAWAEYSLHLMGRWIAIRDGVSIKILFHITILRWRQLGHPVKKF